MPSTEVTLAKGQIIHGARDIIQLKESEIQQGKIVIATLEKLPNISKHKLTRIRGRVRFLERFVELIKQGFIPIPRLEYTPIDPEYYVGGRKGWVSEIIFDNLPVEAIETISAYKDVFTRIGLVPARRPKKRDPILIGILRYGHNEEHFLLAWWRPDLMRPIELW